MSLKRRNACAVLWGMAGLPAWAAEPAALRVGWGDYPPFQGHGPDGPTGLDIDLVTLIAAAAGERVRWLRRPWARQLADLAHGELDVVCSATHSPDRLAMGRFTLPYRQERVALMTLVGGAPAVKRLADLQGRQVRIGMIRGAVFPESVRREIEACELGSVLQSMHANDLTLQALRQRKVDYVIEDPVTMMHRASTNAGGAIAVALELAVSPVHLLVSGKLIEHRPDVLDRLNQGLQRARQQPPWGQALARYASVQEPSHAGRAMDSHGM